VYTDLFNFDGNHGASPSYPEILAQGRDGNLYGTAPLGDEHGFGVVFRVTTSGTARILHDFSGGDGANPYSGLTLGTDGNFYGTTSNSHNGYGTIFRIAPNGVLTTLYFFNSATGQAQAPPIQAGDGNFYGTAGVKAYKITPAGAFSQLGSIPGISNAPLLQAADGGLYGTTEAGGKAGTGTVFRIDLDGAVTIAYEFSAMTSTPRSPLIQVSDGSFYGTTVLGGSYGDGVVFRLIPKQGITALHNFPDPNYPNDGAESTAGLVEASDGNFYGVTTGGLTGPGVIFEVTASGAYSVLYVFDSTSGASPGSTPTQHTNGKIYGLAASGGVDNQGVLYSFDLGLPPFVRLLPSSGRAGRTIEFLGEGLMGTSAVSFNGTTASFDVRSDTFLTAVVPAGATTGVVTVVTPEGTLSSNQSFRVTH
jgi:uncharacterized repeat protein (TIGR03803 family)